MKRLRSYILALASVLCLTAAVPASAYAAWNPFDGACSSGGGASTVCSSDKGNTQDSLGGSDGLIMKIVNIIAYITGVAAVIIIILAGLRFVTSGGGAEDVKGARRALIYAAVGLVIVVLARTLVAWILSKL